MTPIVHYAPGDASTLSGDVSILCGNNAGAADGTYTDVPNGVRGCEICLKAVAEDLADKDGQHMGVCFYCQEEITAVGGVAWRRATNSLCPCCGIDGWKRWP